MAVLTLAQGIGGSTTMYGVPQWITRFGQPTVPEPERVARLFAVRLRESGDRGPVSYGDYRRWQETARSFEDLAAYAQQTLPLRTAEGVDEVNVLSVTPSYLSLLKTPPVIGRIFSEQDLRTGDARPALLTERAWRSRFGADPAVVGRILDLDGQGHTLVGVMAEGLGLVMPPTDLFVPLVGLDDSTPVRVMGRRHDSASWTQASEEMNAIGAAVETAQEQWRVRVVPILDGARFRIRE